MQEAILDTENLEDEEFDSPLLTTFRNANIANFIIHEACQLFYKTYKKKWIPFSFIEFYFEEYKRNDFLSKNFLEPFFKIYTEADTLPLINNYTNCHYSVITDKKNKNSQLHYYINDSYYLFCNMEKNEHLGMFDPTLYKELGSISQNMKDNDELITTKDAYEYFMLKKFIIDKDRKVKFKETQKKAIEETKNDVSNIVLVGTQTEVPKQNGKVTKIFFPKLSLPSPYPILIDKSRINSEHRVKKLLRADTQIKIINKFRFNGVKYTAAFIEKRKAAKKPQKRKFDFDF